MIVNLGLFEGSSLGDSLIIRCDSSTFIKKVERVRWRKPHSWREWLFGQRCTFWKCAKCGEEFLHEPKGQCLAELTRD